MHRVRSICFQFGMGLDWIVVMVCTMYVRVLQFGTSMRLCCNVAKKSERIQMNFCGPSIQLCSFPALLSEVYPETSVLNGCHVVFCGVI